MNCDINYININNHMNVGNSESINSYISNSIDGIDGNTSNATNNDNAINIEVDLNIPRLYKPKSNVWKYYTSDCDPNGKSIMRCTFCEMSFSHYTSKNATKLKQHLIQRCKAIPHSTRQDIVSQLARDGQPLRIKREDNGIDFKLNNKSVKSLKRDRNQHNQLNEHIDENEDIDDNLRGSASAKPNLMKGLTRVGAQHDTQHDAQQVSKYKKLQEENARLSSRLRISLKQNEALINITRHLTQCFELMKKLQFLKSNQQKTNPSEIDALNSQIEVSDELVNEWRLKYKNIELEESDKNEIFRTQGHKPQSSIWKYYKLVEKNTSDGYKTIKCSFCDKMFRQKVLNAYKCRTHIVEKCEKCPQNIREEEDILTEPHAKSKVAIWQHFIVNDEEGKAYTECSYCGITYSGKNATKCREHLLLKCLKIPEEVKQTICSQCDDHFLRHLQQPIKSKISIWEHYSICEETDGKISCRCIYCGTIYAHKNATKCKEHLLERCDRIKPEVRSDIANQCEEAPSRTWTQTKIPIWEHFVIAEEDGKTTCECSYCGITYATKNATKCRLHLLFKCHKIPPKTLEKVRNESGDAYLNGLQKKNPKKSNFMVRQKKLFVRSALGKAGRPKCQIWQYFSDELDSEGKTIRRCTYCETAFGFRTSRNATKLRDHLVINCRTAPEDIKKNVDLEDGFIRTIKDHRNREGERRYQCCWPGCDLAFPKRSRLLKHQLVHTGSVERIKCDWPGCDWSGRDRFSVKIHKYRHTGEKPWTCDWPGCDFKTAKPSSLYIHKLRHNNLRRFKCEWPGCERAFLTNSQRKVHKMVHLGLKPYACQLCDKRFPAPNKLKLHQNKHHSNQQIVSF